MGCAGSAIAVRCLQNVWHRDFSPEKLTPVYGCLNVQSGCRHDAGVPVRRRHPGDAGTERSTGGLRFEVHATDCVRCSNSAGVRYPRVE